MRSSRFQRGLAAAAVIVVLILAMVVLALGRSYFQGEALLDQRGFTDANFRRVSDALVGFAALNARLPCPAGGSSPDGTEQPAGPIATCTHEDGVVPWVTLGLRREDAVDGWGAKLSYRVYAATGSSDGFTRTNGLNATNCSTEVAVGGATEVVPECDAATHIDHPVHFFRSTVDASRLRGLAVNDRGTAKEGLAFVLISHGSSGRGAFGGESGIRSAAPASAAELRNMQAPSSPPWGLPFLVNARSDASVPPGDTEHFDDMVAYMAATELVARAKLGARAWPAQPLVADAAAVTAAAPGFDPAVTQNTGRSSLVFGRVTITASSNLGAQNIGFREGDGTGGIGVIRALETTGGSISSTNSEVLTLDAGAGSTFQKADVALNEFQTRTFSPFAKELVEISVWRTPEGIPAAEPVLVQATVFESWHSAPGPSLCLFESIPGTIFDRMQIRPLTRSDGGSSSVTLAAIKACSVAAEICLVAVPDPDARRCTTRPPSAATSVATSVGPTSVTLNGLVDDNDSASAVTFDYGTTVAYGTSVAGSYLDGFGNPQTTVPAGKGPTAVSASLTGLACNTTYHFRAKAVSAGGTTRANDSIFTTAACPP